MDPMKLWTYSCPTKLYMGIGAHQKLAEILSNWGIHHLFFLSDRGVAATEIFALAEQILRAHDIKSPDKGFYQLPYSYKPTEEGSTHVKRDNFNPDVRDNKYSGWKSELMQEL